MTDWFNFRLQAITHYVLRDKWLKASRRLKWFDYELKPYYDIWRSSLSLWLVVQYFNLTLILQEELNI